MIAAFVFFAPPKIESKQSLIAPPPKLEYFSFGYQMVIADNLWVRAIQDFDYCENYIEKNVCKGNGWLSEMLDTATNLAPDYQVIYRKGGLALTVIVSDFMGATRLFDKGVAMFPKDIKLLWAAAYHSMIEEKDPEKAAKRLILAAQNGAQPWFYSLATRLYTEAGKKELAKGLYEQLKDTNVESGTLERIRKKLDIE